MSFDTASEGSFGHLARSASKMMDQMQKGFFVYSPETWTPNVNLYETESSYFVCVDLSGVEKEKIDVEVADGRLTLRGSRINRHKSPEAASLPRCEHQCFSAGAGRQSEWNAAESQQLIVWRHAR